MNSQIFGTIGLVFDILGAILVAIDVIRGYEGDKIIQGSQTDTTPPKEPQSYASYKKQTRILMIIGLFLLAIGFALQACALWMN